MPDPIIETVRIPELTQFTGTPKNPFKLPFWNSDNNATQHMDFALLRAFMTEGLTASRPPVIVGNTYVVVVSAAEAGGTTFLVPEVANQEFNLYRQGQGIMKPGTWEVLDAGGFKLMTPGDKLVLGETFELSGMTPGGGGTGNGGGGLNFGLAKPIATNYAVNPTDIGSVFQIRGKSALINITLPDITAIPLYSITPFEAAFDNVTPARILTTGGQKIYLNNGERTSLWIHQGEIIWLYNTTAGWTVVNQYGNWGEIGKVEQSYIRPANTAVLQGGLLKRSDYPRLWEAIQNIGASLVTEAIWQTAQVTVDGIVVARPFRGCFSTGTITSGTEANFRLPDYQQAYVKGLKSGADTTRYSNILGSFQAQRTGPHSHFTFFDNGTTYNNLGLGAGNYPEKRAGNGAGEGNGNYEYSIRGNSNTANVGLTSPSGSGTYGNQVDNIGLNFYIKY